LDQTLGVHETLDMHEILMFKNICLTKSATMSAIAVSMRTWAKAKQKTIQSGERLPQLNGFHTSNILFKPV